MNRVVFSTVSALLSIVVVRGYIIDDLNMSIVNRSEVEHENTVKVYDVPKTVLKDERKEEQMVTINMQDKDTINLTGLIESIKNTAFQTELPIEYRELIFQKSKKAMSYQCPVETYFNYYGDIGSSSIMYGDIKIHSEDANVVLNYDCQNQIISTISITEEVLHKDNLYYVKYIFDRVENSYYLNTFYILDKNKNTIVGEYLGDQLLVHYGDHYVMYVNRGNEIEYVKYYFDNNYIVESVLDEFTISKVIYDEFNRIQLRVSIMYENQFHLDDLNLYTSSIEEYINMYQQNIKIESIKTFLDNKYKKTTLIILEEYEYVPNTTIPLNSIAGTSDTGLIQKSAYGYYLSQGYYYLIYKPNLTMID